MGYTVKIYIFNDLAGNEFVWFASRDCNELEVDCSYRIKATIKGHKVFRGTKQTVINRPKIIGPYIAPVEISQDDLSGSENIADIWNSL
jgi:hypothetical protein